MKSCNFWLVSISLCTMPLMSQSDLPDQDIYTDVINRYCKGLQIFSGVSDTTLYIEEGLVTTKNLPRQLNGCSLELMSYDQIYSRARKGSFEILRLIPIRIHDDQFYITLVGFEVERKKKRLHYTNQGGEKFYYDFNCDEGKLEFSHAH
jgi:hypothetical protein